jgi:hypothetical protein
VRESWTADVPTGGSNLVGVILALGFAVAFVVLRDALTGAAPKLVRFALRGRIVGFTFRRFLVGSVHAVRFAVALQVRIDASAIFAPEQIIGAFDPVTGVGLVAGICTVHNTVTLFIFVDAFSGFASKLSTCTGSSGLASNSRKFA